MRTEAPNNCIQRTRRLRFVSMLNVCWRRVADGRRYQIRRVVLLGIAVLGALALGGFVVRPSGPLVAIRVTDVEAVQDLPSGDQGPEHWVVTFEMTNLTKGALSFDGQDSRVCAKSAGGWVELKDPGVGYLQAGERGSFALLLPGGIELCRFSLRCTPESMADTLESFLRYNSLCRRLSGASRWAADRLPKPRRRISAEILLPRQPTHQPQKIDEVHNERPGVDAGWPLLVALPCAWPRATQAGCYV